MSIGNDKDFITFLNRHDAEAWQETLRELQPSIHEVDRAATEIWFAFYPLDLAQILERAEDRDKLARELLLQGNYRLRDQIDSSHHFLYGHRFWKETKEVVVEYAKATTVSEQLLAAHIREAAKRVAAITKREESLLVGITAVAFMTLQQIGIEALQNSPGTVAIEAKHLRKTPEQILKERARDDGQGAFGFLRTTDKKWTVVFDEADPAAKFKVIEGEELASGAARDHSRDWRASDPRRIEGPIPVECRSAACGTCWVGILGGAEKLSNVTAREGKQIKLFGYINTDEAQPAIRLACMAQASGAVSIVIPPWNGVFGKHLQKQKEAQS